MRFGLLITTVVIAGGFIFWKDINHLAENDLFKSGKKSSKAEYSEKKSVNVKVEERWDLPETLREISGISYLDDNRMACIQDEAGTIYVFDRASKKIAQEIPFGAPGDYEGITTVGSTAYVVRADGRLFEVDLKSGKKGAKEYKTPLSVAHNIEGLCYDQKQNRLLLAAKDGAPGSKDYRGIYAFDLATKTMAKEPVYKIENSHELFANGKDKSKGVSPSAIGIHPKTGDIYTTDGPKSRLLIMNSNGELKKLHDLGKEFEQPEGLTFSPDGTLFISNEGKKKSGNIMQVKLN